MVVTSLPKPGMGGKSMGSVRSGCSGRQKKTRGREKAEPNIKVMHLNVLSCNVIVLEERNERCEDITSVSHGEAKAE